MKHTLLFFLFVVLSFQTGCANNPSMEEQMQQQQQANQNMKKSDAFAHDLQQ